MAKAIHEYCDIAGMSRPEQVDRPCYYAHDGSTCSIIRVHGASTLLSEDEAVERTSAILTSISAQMRRDKRHALTITYERHNTIEEDIERLVMPMRDAARRKALAMGAALDETEEILRGAIVSERILIAAWTYQKATVKSQFADDRRRRQASTARLPLRRPIQDLNGPYESFQAAHFGFVNSLVGHLMGEGFRCDLLGSTEGREDLAEVRRALLYHETPQHWAPKPAGGLRYPKAKAGTDDDISNLFASTIDRQLMTSGASATSDLRSVSMGGRTYAIAHLSEFPQHLTAFRSLLRHMLGGSARRDPMPFRIAFHLEGGANIPPVRQVLSTIGAIFSTANKRIKTAYDGIDALMKADHATFLTMRIFATTWIEPGEETILLEERRSRLIRSLNSWQSPTVTDTAPDPMRLLSETVAGLVAVPRTGLGFLAPAAEAGFALPLHSEAPAEDEGETVFVTVDDKPFPVQAHSPLLDNWFTLVLAGPGSGKSVLMNSMNLDFAAFTAAARLPFIGIIDVGESSTGLIDTLRAALPPSRKNEASFVTLRNEVNDRDSVLNPFDIGLGRRRPLQRERGFTKNFLKAMAGVDHPGIDALIDTVIDVLYVRYSDGTVSSHAKLYQPDQDRAIDAALDRFAIEAHDNLTWWHLADGFARRGEWDLAERAQRHAMPIMVDVISVLSTPEMQRRHGDALCLQVRTQIESAINQFPCFSSATTLDIAAARVVAIDLKRVIVLQPASEADIRSNMLFFLAARELFVKKVSGDEGELQSMQLPADRERHAVYAGYWRRRYQEIQQTRKRLCFDEFHITGTNPIMLSQIDQDVRQGRKWGLEVVLASQKIGDFDKFVELASTYYVLKADTASEAERIQGTLGFSDAVRLDLQRYCKGPIPGIGAVLLVGRQLRNQSSWLLARNKIGPVRLWALSTTQEDRAVRKRLYERTGDVGDALRILAARFPSGTCRRTWQQAAKRLDRSDDIADHIAAELLSEAPNALEDA